MPKIRSRVKASLKASLGASRSSNDDSVNNLHSSDTDTETEDRPEEAEERKLSSSSAISTMSNCKIDDNDDDNDERSDSDDDDDCGVQLHGMLRLKNILYYKRHTKTAIPIKGMLCLGPKTVSFQSKGLDYSWNLDSICVQKFKGRVKGGVKILGRMNSGDGGGGEEREKEEFIFTNLKQKSYDMMCSSVEGAKFDSEMTKIRRSTMNKAASSGISLSRSLASNDDILEDNERSVRMRVRPSPAILLRPIRFVFLVVFKVIALIFKLFTGKRLRLFGPKNKYEALLQVLTKIRPIHSVAKRTLSERRVLAIETDIRLVNESFIKMQRTLRLQQSEWLSNGAIADALDESAMGISGRERFLLAIHTIRQRASFAFFTVRKALNVPDIFFRWDLILQPYQHPTTVQQAVQNANYKLVALMELARDDEDDFHCLIANKVLEECRQVQLLFCNIKVHASGESKNLRLSRKEE